MLLKPDKRTLSWSYTKCTLAGADTKPNAPLGVIVQRGGGDGYDGVEMPAVESWPELVEVAAWLLMRDGDDVEAGVDRSGGVVLVVVSSGGCF
ncbi:hypothetical protein Tco_1464407 [Tanacetum coccineum]